MRKERMNCNSCTRLTLLAELLLLDGFRGSPLYYTSFFSLPMYVIEYYFVFGVFSSMRSLVDWFHHKKKVTRSRECHNGTEPNMTRSKNKMSSDILEENHLLSDTVEKNAFRVVPLCHCFSLQFITSYRYWQVGYNHIYRLPQLHLWIKRQT